MPIYQEGDKIIFQHSGHPLHGREFVVERCTVDEDALTQHVVAFFTTEEDNRLVSIFGRGVYIHMDVPLPIFKLKPKWRI